MKQEFWVLYNLLLQCQPQKSDAIVWLQGDQYDRAYKVLELYKTGFSELVIITGNDQLIGSNIRQGENNISFEEMVYFLIKRGVKKEHILQDKKSLDTKGQAIAVINLAKENHWKIITIVSSAYNQPRALLTFLNQARQQKWMGIINNQPAIFDLESIPGGREETVNQLIVKEMKKIENYKNKNDLVEIREGLTYLNYKS
jgi:hypothetical protein